MNVGPCFCGYYLVRPVEDKPGQYECVACGQQLLNLEETTDATA